MHAPATSVALRMAETTQILFAPVPKTSSMFFKWIPPMANHGTATFAAAHLTYSSVTGFAVGFVPVANTGPMQSRGSSKQAPSSYSRHVLHVPSWQHNAVNRAGG